MDDLISRQAAIDAVKSISDSICEQQAIDALCELPSIDAVQVVKCNDCKYAYITNDGECKYCDIWFPDEAEYLDGDYYCASAERKEE